MTIPIHILIIDDDDVDRLTVCRHLKKAVNQPLAFTEASDAASGIEQLKQHHFDCVFLDYMLPDNNGLYILDVIRDQDIDVSVVALTGHGDERLVIELMQSGACDYLSKDNMSPETLSHRLFSALRLHKAEQERKKIKSDLNQALAASKAKSEILGIISHELRTPLHAIIGYSDLMEEKLQTSNDEDMEHYLKSVQTSGGHLLRLVEDILMYTKIESGTVEVNIHEFSSDKLIDDIVETLYPIAQKNNNQIVLNTSPGHRMVTDANKLRQILQNITDNGLKFTRNGTITISSRSEHTQELGDVIHFSISDSGVGIDKNKLSTLFNKQQLDNSKKRKYDGLGIGMAISQSFCKMIGGSIAVDSTTGKGSTFTISIPAELDHTLGIQQKESA